MTQRLRLPGLVDILRTADPALIHRLAGDARLGRDFRPVGPFLNRLIMGRLRATFNLGGLPFAGVAPRDHPGRAEGQAALEARLAALSQPVTPEHLAKLSGFLLGTLPEDDLGPAVQTVVGGLFAPGFRAGPETWRAACLLDAAPRSRNPLALRRGSPRAAVVRARDLLARGVGTDPAALHATSIAVHTLVRSLKAMRAIWQEGPDPRRISPAIAVSRSLRAPQQVLRVWSTPATTALGDMYPGSLVVFELDSARQRQPDPQTIFMVESWSRCPAHAWTASLLVAIWSAAVDAQGDVS
jgi:hypothetical protein